MDPTDEQRHECSVSGCASGQGVRWPSHADRVRMQWIGHAGQHAGDSGGVAGIGARVDRHDRSVVRVGCAGEGGRFGEADHGGAVELGGETDRLQNADDGEVLFADPHEHWCDIEGHAELTHPVGDRRPSDRGWRARSGSRCR